MNLLNSCFAYLVIVAVCRNGAHCIKNIPSITTASGDHPVGKHSITTGGLDEYRLLSLSVHLALVPLLGLPVVSHIALG